MDLGTAIASAWSAGISMYGVAALLGIAGRVGWTDAPELLERGSVIALAVALWLFELVVDKIPVVDTLWDSVHTVLRPAAGAALALAAQDVSIGDVALAGTGGVLALSAHLAKSSVRVVVNASPEPFSNILLSTSEDGLVAGVMVLALAYPEVALALTVVFAVASAIVAVAAFRLARRIARRFTG